LVLNAPRFQPASENGLNADYSRGLLERYGKNEGETVIYDLTRTPAAAPSSSRSGPGYRPPAAPPGESYQTRF
jgi:hypothetical protein